MNITLIYPHLEDPDVTKPEDWVDEKKIDDPEDKKPNNWDDVPETKEDLEAKRPADWDDETDGEWVRPVISNPDFKGVWRPKKIPNPAYKGEWVHPQISNPEYKPHPELYAREFTAIGFDLWQVKSGSIFDNLIVATDLDECKNTCRNVLETQI